jgi:hypothetical protein
MLGCLNFTLDCLDFRPGCLDFEAPGAASGVFKTANAGERIAVPYLYSVCRSFTLLDFARFILKRA